MVSRSSTGSGIYLGGLGGVVGGGGGGGGGGFTTEVGSAISVKECFSSPPCRVAAACSYSQFPHYRSLSRSMLMLNQGANTTHHVEYRAHIALVPHPPNSLSDKMRARRPESAVKPYLLARITSNAWMRDLLLVVVLHDRQRRGQMYSCHGRFLAQLAIYDEGRILIVLVLLQYVLLEFRRRRETVHGS